MNILIKIGSDSELIAYEAVALAMLLASFDHKVQVYLTGKSDYLLKDKSTRLFGMVQSFALYDMPMAWTDFILDDFDPSIQAVLKPAQGAFDDFDSVLEF